jgi:ADP-heptose:LPS heptosyltransferase
MLSYLAGTEQGRELAKALDHSGLANPSRMLDHWHRGISPTGYPPQPVLNQLEKILLPSRITTGADVAISSVLIERLLRALPLAEIVLVGPAHLAELFSGLPRVRHLNFSINRQGTLAERLLYWPALLKATAREIDGSEPGRILVLDPDSRLTQLGLLPLATGIKSCQFPSQTLAEEDIHQPLSLLANLWLDRLLGEAPPAYPFISPPLAARLAAASFCGRLRDQGAHRLLLVNFGVGGDLRKSLSDEFEEQLLRRLLEREKTIIILDSGSGSEEKSRANKLLVRLNGARATSPNWQPPGSAPFSHGLIGLCSSLGELAATCGEVDGYLGYDSCGQHLANAAATPGVTIFTGHPNRRFLARWSPWSRDNLSTVIPVDRDESSQVTMTATIDRALLALNHTTAQR